METQIAALKPEIVEMWMLLRQQLRKCRNAMLHFDRDIAFSVLKKIRDVGRFESSIDQHCERIMTIYSPEGKDLRFVLMVLKINNSLNRIGMLTGSIAREIADSEFYSRKSILEKMQLPAVYDDVLQMMELSLAAFEQEDMTASRSVYRLMENIEIAAASLNTGITQLAKEHAANVAEALAAASVVYKLERVADQCRNIACEVIFFSEAKTFRHKSPALSQA